MKKKYFIILLIISVSFIIRETIFRKLNHFTHKTYSKAEKKFSDKSLVIDLENDNKNQKNMLFEKHSYILISKNDTILISPGYGEPIIWRIEKLDIDFNIIPFYRNIKFKSKITCQTEGTIIKLKKNKLRSIQSNIDATIEVIGNTKITGLSSIYNDKQIVNKAIGTIIKEKTQEILKILDNRYGI